MTKASDSAGRSPAGLAPRKGPWTHRVSIFVLCTVLMMLSYWLLGFVIRDVGNIDGPEWEALERRHLDAEQVAEKEKLEGQLEDVKREIGNQIERQTLLRDGTRTVQTTIGQMLEMQKLSLEKGVSFPPSEMAALQKAREDFLASQDKYFALIEDISTRKEEQRNLEASSRAVNETLSRQRVAANGEYSGLLRRHNIKLAFIKLGILLPIALIVGWLFLKTCGSVYRPLVYAVGLAVFWKVGVVIHAHFPSVYFKYIVILLALGIVLKFLFYLLKMIVAPKRDWLLKQYREAYEKFLCPVCSYPIRRGPLKYLFWTSRSIKKLVVPPLSEKVTDEAYTCPCCATALYEKCGECGSVRAGLLPACDHCGAEKDFAVTIPSE
jgi:hypothetical protein